MNPILRMEIILSRLGLDTGFLGMWKKNHEKTFCEPMQVVIGIIKSSGFVIVSLD